MVASTRHQKGWLYHTLLFLGVKMALTEVYLFGKYLYQARNTLRFIYTQTDNYSGEKKDFDYKVQ